MLRRFDSCDPDADLRHDGATALAWAQVNATGLHDAKSEQPLIALMLDLIRADLTGDSRHNIVQRDFSALTGRADLSAFDRVTWMSLLIAGKVAVWNKHDEALSGMDHAAACIVSTMPGLLGAEAKPQSDAPCPAPLPSAVSGEEVALDPNLTAVASRMNAM